MDNGIAELLDGFCQEHLARLDLIAHKLATRTLLQVSIDDAAEAERTVSELMGDQVEPRKEFIQKHARDVRFLDI